MVRMASQGDPAGGRGMVKGWLQWPAGRGVPLPLGMSLPPGDALPRKDKDDGKEAGARGAEKVAAVRSSQPWGAAAGEPTRREGAGGQHWGAADGRQSTRQQQGARVFSGQLSSGDLYSLFSGSDGPN